MTSTQAEAPAPAVAELLPGYRADPVSGAWLTLPWPDRLEDLPPSLGPQIIRWAEEKLVHPLTGAPWRYTPSQRRFVHLWFAVRPDGRWLYRSGVKRGAKGTGKDGIGASLAVVEAVGPVALAGWEGATPIGVPYRMALVQIGANSEAQARDLLRVASAMVSGALAEESGFDRGDTRSQFESGTRIELLTRSEASSEGDPVTAVILNETHHATRTSGGQALAAVARRNAAKGPGGRARLLELTNAHLPGEGSVAEDSFDAWQAQVSGRAKRADILYDSREAPSHLRLHIEAELEAGIAAAYSDSPWTDLERIRDEAQDLRVPAADSVRFYFNAIPTNELAWVDARAFDALARPQLNIADGDPVALFLDCSKSSDATALVASRISDGHVVVLGGWQRPHGDRGTGWLAPRPEVDAAVRLAFDRWDVRWFGVDPSPARDDETEAQYWAGLIDDWHRNFRERLPLWATPGRDGSSVLFDARMSAPGGRERNRLFTEAAERCAADIDDEGTLTWDGNPMLRVHVHNARRRSNLWGTTLGKQSRGSSRLVDLAVAMVGARLGRRLVLNAGKGGEKKRSGVVW